MYFPGIGTGFGYFLIHLFTNSILRNYFGRNFYATYHMKSRQAFLKRQITSQIKTFQITRPKGIYNEIEYLSKRKKHYSMSCILVLTKALKFRPNYFVLCRTILNRKKVYSVCLNRFRDILYITTSLRDYKRVISYKYFC